MKQGEQGSSAWEMAEKALLANFGFDATPSQSSVIYALARFIASQRPNCLFIIKGYAGTGKTTLVNTLVRTLQGFGWGSVLLAPTGRAAKVLGAYASQRASTIHRRIYHQKLTAAGGMYFERAYNPSSDTVFVVDEASMISWEQFTGLAQGNLLLDLFEYVFSAKNCRLVLIGDGAQLPPVGSAASPALDLAFLQSQFSITAAMGELSDVVRQSKDSGILMLATAIRAALFLERVLDAMPFKMPEPDDVRSIHGGELQDVLEEEFSNVGQENVILISRSNKRCNLFNQQIRQRILFRDGEIASGDYLMAVKNNYTWLEPTSAAGFIANGDVMEVQRIRKEINHHGYLFADLSVRLVDYPNEPALDVMVWVDCLHTEGPSMPKDATDRLYRLTSEAYAHLPTKAERRSAIKSDPFWNAVQVKFAYALTCHKAQGGQWPVVIVDQGYLTDEMMNTEFLRWLYTAVTRATERLYLLNFENTVIEKPAPD